MLPKNKSHAMLTRTAPHRLAPHHPRPHANHLLAHPPRPKPLPQPRPQRQSGCAMGALLLTPRMVERRNASVRLHARVVGKRTRTERVQDVQSAVQLRAAGARGDAGGDRLGCTCAAQQHAQGAVSELGVAGR